VLGSAKFERSGRVSDLELIRRATRSAERVARDDHDRRPRRVEGPRAQGPSRPTPSVIARAATTPPSPRSFSTARRSLQTCGCRLRDVGLLGARLPFVEDWRAATFHRQRPRQPGNLLRRRMARDRASAHQPARRVRLSLYVRRDRPCDIPLPGAAAPDDRLSLRFGRERLSISPESSSSAQLGEVRRRPLEPLAVHCQVDLLVVEGDQPGYG
jgi:hypothetical protein